MAAVSGLDREDIKTITCMEQERIRCIVNRIYRIFDSQGKIDPAYPKLKTDDHVGYLKHILFHLSAAYCCLDCSRPWLCYWIIHSLILLKQELDEHEKNRVVQFLNNCQCASGGFGGGPGQYAHLACTFGAVNALCCLGTDEAFRIINREKLKDFLVSLKCPSGAFYLEVGGEADIRGAYCAASIASITNLDKTQLFENTAEWVASCQTYEGGFGGGPFLESHGGYSYCGIAALALLGRTDMCNINSLLRWTTMKQLPLEGGFQGRSNKLVDSCYSFWQGAIFPILHDIKGGKMFDNVFIGDMFNKRALQRYILLCCQDPYGGFIDKPQKSRDAYHTCYALSGLSVAQHFASCTAGKSSRSDEHLLARIEPLHNLEEKYYKKAISYFSQMEAI